MFLAPLTLIGLALVSLPVLIHLLVRRRARRLDFPSLRFLRETPSFRLYPRHVRQPLLLALRIAALALIVMGLARPFISFNARGRHTRVILIDASLSMKARGRAEAAREQARAILNKLGPGESAAILAFSSEAFVLAEATNDRKRLADALGSYEPSGGATDYGLGIAAAAALLLESAPGTAEIDLISDFQESELAAQVSELTGATASTAARIVPYAVGAAPERNAFLSDATLSRNAQGGIELSATEIISEADGQSGARRAWAIDAVDGSRPEVQWHTEANGQITGVARTNAPDDFDADDRLFFAFEPPRENRALLVETGAEPYLRAALEAAALDGGKRLALDRKSELPATAAELASYSLVVLTLHGAPREAEVRSLSEYASAGGTAWLLLARDIDTESWNALAATEQGSALPFVSLSRTNATEPFGFGAVDADAPALRTMGQSALAALRSTRVRAGFVLTPREGAVTLARWSDREPAFVSAKAGMGSMLLLATSPEREASELGLSPALPALAYSILSAAGRARDEPISVTIGEPVRINAHADVDVTVTNADGHTTRVKARELSRRPFGVFREAGVYRLEFAGQQRFMAFNAAVPESARALATPEEIKNYLGGKEGRPAAATAANNWREAAERRG
ncbi:MAG TPA: BatA domain-containing protein, partial [Pyrinomonadaceae bacterium]|nr:BatA domain-containing protein [Pyrinomonadaceae bacterium]